jgi:hypothetical protein
MQRLRGLRIKQLRTGADSAPRASDAQRWARLDELAEARCQLDEELAPLHQELGMDAEPRD